MQKADLQCPKRTGHIKQKFVKVPKASVLHGFVYWAHSLLHLGV